MDASTAYLFHVAETLETVTKLNALQKNGKKPYYLGISKNSGTVFVSDKRDKACFKEITDLVENIIKNNPDPQDKCKTNLLNTIKCNYSALAQGYLERHKSDWIEKKTTKQAQKLFAEFSPSLPSEGASDVIPSEKTDIASVILKSFDRLNTINKHYDSLMGRHVARHYFLKVNTGSSVKSGKSLPLSIVNQHDKSSLSDILDFVEDYLKSDTCDLTYMSTFCDSIINHLEAHIKWLEEKLSKKKFLSWSYAENKIRLFFAKDQLARAKEIKLKISPESGISGNVSAELGISGNVPDLEDLFQQFQREAELDKRLKNPPK